jgi:zinc transporter 5/7
MFMLIVADTLGSIGIILSCLFIENWGLLVLDPMVSLLIACLILRSVWPLMKDNARILLLTVPVGLERNVQQALLQLLSMEGVKGYKNHRFWVYSPEVYTGSIHIQVTQETNEQNLIRNSSSLFSSIGFTHFTVQVEKDEFIARRSLNVGGTDENSNKDKELRDSLSSNPAQVHQNCQKDNSHVQVLLQ